MYCTYHYTGLVDSVETVAKHKYPVFYTASSCVQRLVSIAFVVTNVPSNLNVFGRAPFL